MDAIYHILPTKLSGFLIRLPPEKWEHIEEIRIRAGKPVEISSGLSFELLPIIVTDDDAVQLLQNLTNFSMYTMEEELRRGYITIQGGHRVGLAGKVILEQGHVKAIIHISSFNIRIAKEKKGCAEPLLPFLYGDEWQSTLIIGPPQSGKTTLLRDIARIVSSGYEKKEISARKVGIVDERSEITGCVKGIPQLEFGPRMDVLDACPKAEGMMMLIRSMSPEVIIADEIGRREDAVSVLEAANAGIKLMLTVHGHSMEDIEKRPAIKEILSMQVFERIIVLKRGKYGFGWCAMDRHKAVLRREEILK